MSKEFRKKVEALLDLHASEYKAGHITKMLDAIDEIYKEETLKIIGDSETHWTDHFGVSHNVPTDSMNARNDLREEQRKQLGMKD